jgi:transcriptional regulator with XRE-family HTH domain
MKYAEIARQLGISRAYVTMLAKGERQPSRGLQRRIEKLTGKRSLSVTNSRVWDHEVGGSNPLTPTISFFLTYRTMFSRAGST